MTTKKVPIRTCVACNQSKPKRDLLRVVRCPDGSMVVDLRGKVSGRGAYLCRTRECIDLGIKNHRLERALDHAIAPELVQELFQATPTN